MKFTFLQQKSWFFCIAIFYVATLLSTQKSHSTIAANGIFSEDTTADSLQQLLIDSLEKKLYDQYSIEFECEQIEDQIAIIVNDIKSAEAQIITDSLANDSVIRSVLNDTNYISIDTARWLVLAQQFCQLPDFNAKKDSIHANQKDSLLRTASYLFTRKNQSKSDSMNLVTTLETYRKADKRLKQAAADVTKQYSALDLLKSKKENCVAKGEKSKIEPNELVAQQLSGLLIKDSGMVFEKTYKKKKYLCFKYTIQSGQDSFELSIKGNRTKAPRTIKAAWDKQIAAKEQPVFVMNAGMFKDDYSAQGLLIEKTKENFPINPLDTDTTNKGKSGNFYLHPNGVFYIKNDGRCYLSTTAAFIKEENHKSPNNESSFIKFATQSGPMLVINKKIHKAFNPSSKNVNIRNGIGIRNIGKTQEVYMVISIDQVTFHEMASFYKDILRCENALYLDGVVSRMYVQLGKKQWGKLDNSMGLGPLLMVTKKKMTAVSANKK